MTHSTRPRELAEHLNKAANDHGDLIEEGAHAKLIEANGKYHEDLAVILELLALIERDAADSAIPRQHP